MINEAIVLYRTRKQYEIFRDRKPAHWHFHTVGGVSWEASEPDVFAARRVVAFLEDRRVLYVPDELEVPSNCVRSVLDIRHFLTAEVGTLATESEFKASLRAMRTVCRKFLDHVGQDGRNVTLHANMHGHWAS